MKDLTKADFKCEQETPLIGTEFSVSTRQIMAKVSSNLTISKNPRSMKVFINRNLIIISMNNPIQI